MLFGGIDIDHPHEISRASLCIRRNEWQSWQRIYLQINSAPDIGIIGDGEVKPEASIAKERKKPLTWQNAELFEMGPYM